MGAQKFRKTEGIERVEQVRPSWYEKLIADLGSTPPDEDGRRLVFEHGTGERIPGLAVKPGGVVTGVAIRPTTARQVFAALAEQGLRRLALEAGPAVGEPAEVTP